MLRVGYDPYPPNAKYWYCDQCDERWEDADDVPEFDGSGHPLWEEA